MSDYTVSAEIVVNGANEAIKSFNNFGNTVQNSSSKLETSLKTLVKTFGSLFAIKKIKDFGSTLTQASANISAELAQFTATFKDNIRGTYDLLDESTEMFNRVGNATGVLASRLKVTGTKAFAQFKGAGVEVNEALSRTEQFLNQASDASAYYDISLEDAEAKLRSFLRGNVQAGDSIGLFTSESQRNTRAIEKYGKAYIKLTEAQKQMLMMDITQEIYDQSGATGQAEREADGYANVVGNLKETWRQFLAVIGKPVLERVIPIMQSISEKLISLGDKLENVKTWISEHKEGIDKLKQSLILAGIAVSSFIVISGGLVILQKVVTFVKNFTTSLKVMNTILKANWLTILIAGLVLLSVYLVRTFNTNDEFREKVITSWNTITSVVTPLIEGVISVVLTLWDSLKNLFTAIWEGGAIQMLIEGACTVIKTALEVVLDVIKNVVNFFVEHKDTIATWFDGIIGVITNVIDTITNIVKGDWSNAWNSFLNVFSSLWESIKASITIIIDGITGLFGTTPEKMLEIGENIILGIKNGIFNGWNKLKEGVTEVTGNIVGWFKEKLKIQSPSKIMADEVGTYISQGIAVGMKDGEYYIADSADELAQNGITQLQESIDANKDKNIFSSLFGDIDFTEIKTKITSSSIFKEIAKALGFKIKEEVAPEVAEATNKVVEEVKKEELKGWDKFWDDYNKNLEAFKTKASTISETFSSIMSGIQTYSPINSIVEYQDQLIQNEIDSMNIALTNLKNTNADELNEYQNKYDEENQMLVDKYNQGLISYDEYVSKKQALDDALVEYKQSQTDAEAEAEQELATKKDELSRKQFEANKVNSIASIWISTSQAIMKTFSEMGWIAGIPLSALLLAQAGFQTATIASQQYVPALAKGGIVDKATFAQIGEDGKEAIVPLENNLEWVNKLSDVIQPTMQQSSYDYSLLNKLEDIRNMIADYLSVIVNKNSTLVLDTGVLVGTIDSQLGSLTRLRTRGR